MCIFRHHPFRGNFFTGFFLLLALTACQQGGGNGSPSGHSQGVTVVQQDAGQGNPSNSGLSDWSDLAIAKAIYTDQRVPGDFYQLDTPEDAYYTTYHLKNTDLVAPDDRRSIPVYELSTDDFSQALLWAETAAGYRPVYKQLVDATETNLYFQFTRVDMNNPQFVSRFRVFKSSTLDRSGTDRADPGSFQGTITRDSLTAELVKTIDEYLWTFSVANNYGTAVLYSGVQERSDDFVHTMVEARLEPAFGDECDTITVVAMTFSIQTTTGDIYREESRVRTVYAQRDQSGVDICPIS